jgi:hypothetical protein
MKNKICDKPVDLLSVYPTLTELAGIPDNTSVEGISLVPLLKNPDSDWEQPAITTCGYNNHAIRSERYRYISYADGSEELYDHDSDPNEWNNLAGNPDCQKIILKHKKWIPEKNIKPGQSFNKGEVLFNPNTFEWRLKENVGGNPAFQNIRRIKQECIEHSYNIVESWMPDGYKAPKY